MGRIRDGGDPGRVARRGAEERSPGDIDHLDRLVDADQLDPDRWGERLDVDDDEIDQPDPLGFELIELGRDVATRQDPGIHGVVEGLDLAPDVGLALGQRTDGRDRDALGRKVLARPVRREDLDAGGEQVSCESGDAVPIRD